MGSLLSILDQKDWSLTDPQTILIILATVVGVYVIHSVVSNVTGSKYPPGPTPLPIFGNVNQLSARPKHAHITFHELAKKYGDVYMLKIFGGRLVVLNSAEVVKEAFQKQPNIFSNRPNNYLTSLATKGGNGIVWHKGDGWRAVRRFMLHALRDFGFGKKSMDSKVLEEADAIGKILTEHRGKPYNPSQLIREAVSNVICSVCFGARYEYTDESFRELVDLMDKTISSVGFLEPIDYVPILQYFPFPAKISDALKNFDKINAFMSNQIDEHRATYDKNNPRDFIDLYLEKESEQHGEAAVFSEINMHMMIRDLFFAGSETTATSIRWGLLYMILHPKIQKRLSDEIDEVVGNGRLPESADKANLPYLNAFIMEIFRRSTVAALGLPHICEKDTEVGGFTIPKGANILANIYSVHMSNKYWDNPDEFRPERFLDSNGKALTNKEGFIGFGMGPRQCLGESMARTEIFLMLAYLIQNFRFKMVDENNPPIKEGTLGITLSPEEFDLIITPK